MSEREDHYLRLVTFTVEGCPQPLRALFLQKAQSDIRPGVPYTNLATYLTFHHSKIQHLLHRHFIRRDQVDLIFPPLGNGPADVANWDITLISSMLCNLFQPLPPNEQAYIYDIRQVRNQLHHVATTAQVTNQEFRQKWSLLESAAKGLALCVTRPIVHQNMVAFINDLKFRSLAPPGPILEVLKQWYAVDMLQLKTDTSTIRDNTDTSKDILEKTLVKTSKPSGGVGKRFKTVDTVLVNLQSRFEYTLIQKVPENFNPPPEIDDIKSKLQDHHIVVVTGFDNARHLETTLTVIRDIGYNVKRCVEVHDAQEWRHVCCDDVDLVLFVDPFGKERYDRRKANAMADNIDRILAMTKMADVDDRIDVVFVTLHTILQEFLKYHDIEGLNDVVTIDKPTTQLEPVNLANLRTQRAETEDPVLHNLQGHTLAYIQYMTAYQQDHRLVITHPSQWQYVRLGEISILLIEDFAGKYKLDIGQAAKWYTAFDMIHGAVMEGKLNVIITCEEAKLAKCIDELSNHKLLTHSISLTGHDIPAPTVNTEPGSQSSSTDTGTPGAGDQTNTQLQHRPYTATHAGDFSVKTNDDTRVCDIHESCMLQDGSLLLTDDYNKKLKRLDSSYRVIDVCDIDHPGYVCCISATEVAVSTGVLDNRIQFVSVSGKLTRTRSIQLKHGCRGLAYSSGELYVCDGRRSIHVYSTAGQRQLTIDVSEYVDASFYFGSIAVSDDGSQIYVRVPNSLVCLDKQGHLVWKYTDALRYRGAVCVGNDNNVFVGDGTSVLQISPTGQKTGVIMRTKYNISSICYDRIRSRLIVTLGLCDHISVYDLTTRTIHSIDS